MSVTYIGSSANSVDAHEMPQNVVLVQSVVSRTADPVVFSLILAGSHTFMEIDQCHFPPSADPRRVVVIYKRKYVRKVLVNC